MLTGACLCILVAVTAAPADDMLDVLASELQREQAVLSKQPGPPYFISYAMGDVDSVRLGTSFGVLTRRDQERSRALTVDVRVGDYQLDSSHELRGDGSGFDFGGMHGAVRIARDGDPDAVRVALWRQTDERWRHAVEKLQKVKGNVAAKVEAEDNSADFSREGPAVQYAEPPVDFAALLGDVEVWIGRLKRYSAALAADPQLYVGDANLSFSLERKYLVTSEGARLAQNLSYAHLTVNGVTKADDGMELPLFLSYSAARPADLPAEDKVLTDVAAMAKKLVALRTAPLVDPYTGPAILSGRAAGVFFHEVFGHRVEGHRQKNEDEGQTFKKKVGEQILPKTMNVVFDPTIAESHGFILVGRYAYDDEGVKAQPVAVVDRGVFKNFLMSRSPIVGFPRSNGHGRAQAGHAPVSRQSNMLITSSAPLGLAQLRQKLIAECKAQKKPYGLLFADIEGGFTFTGRDIPNMFNVLPVEVYRVYVDGRPDQLVRGVDLVGTPLVMLSKIALASDRYDVFNGHCGAESGWVPVSAVAPDLLVTQIEVQKKSKSQERPPLLPRPDTEK